MAAPLVRVDIYRVQPVCIKSGRAPDYAVYLVILGKQELGEKRPVLACNPGDEGFFHLQKS